MLFLNISPYSIKILMLLYPIISHVVEHTTWDLRTAPTDPRNEPKWLRNGQLPGVPAAVSAASAPAAGASAAPATLRRVLLRIWQSQSVANATEIWGKSGEISNIQNGAIDGGISIVFLHNIYIYTHIMGCSQLDIFFSKHGYIHTMKYCFLGWQTCINPRYFDVKRRGLPGFTNPHPIPISLGAFPQRTVSSSHRVRMGKPNFFYPILPTIVTIIL